MATTTIPHSFIEVDSDSLPNGFYKTIISDSNTGDLIKQVSTTVDEGVANIKIDGEPNKNVLVTMLDFNTPPLFAEIAHASSIGDIEMFNNETLRLYEGYFDYTEVVTFNGGNSRITTHELDNGLRISLLDNYRITISPNGAYDHLDEGEFERVKIPYTTTESTLGPDLWLSGTENATETSEFNKIDDRTFDPTKGNAEFRWESDSVLEEGAIYELNVTTAQTAGSCDLNWIYPNGSVGSVFAPFNLTQTGTYNRYSYPAPAGVIGIRFRTNATFDNPIVINYLSKEIPAEEKYLEFVVKASEEVSSKLIDPNSFTGTGWNVDGSEYTKPTLNTNRLYGNYSFTEGKIYEVSASVEGKTNGSIKPSILGDIENSVEYSLSDNWREVWYIRSPSNATQVAFDVTNDFDGTIKDIYVRELYCNEVDEPREVEITNPESGKLKLRPIVAPSIGRRSDVEQPDEYYTGVLESFDEQYGVRITDQISYVVEDATATGKRSSISTKGGEWADIWNVTIRGGWLGEDGEPLTPDDKYIQGIITSDNDPIMYQSYVYNCDIDLNLDPMPDNYVTQNSDCYLFNSAHKVSQRTATAYMLNCIGKNASDGIIDNKQVLFVNHCELEGGHRTVRGHGFSQALIASSSLQEQDDSECALHCANLGERFNLWNTSVNGERVVSEYQLRDMIKTGSQYKYEGKAALEGDINSTEIRRNTSVLKTFPRMSPEVRLQISDFTWEYKLSSESQWQELLSTGIFDIGSLTRYVDLPQGIYDLRLKVRNGEHESEWLEYFDIEVS